MSITQNEKLEILKESMVAHQVLELKNIYKTLNVNSRMGAYRYLKQLDYIASYTHGGKYYALRESANFDQGGLWHCGDIGFSKHGTLVDTITHLVDKSDAGKTNDELTKQFKLRVQNTLLQLASEKKVNREKFNKVYLYISNDPERGKQQLRQRKAGVRKKPLSDWIVIEVLVETIRSFHKPLDAKIISSCLRKRGSSIKLPQVQQVFETYSLEKKTRD